MEGLECIIVLVDRKETENINSKLLATADQLRGDEGLIYGNEKEAEVKRF